MPDKPIPRTPNHCPFCDLLCASGQACEHFIGWTDDGKTIESRKPLSGKLVNDGKILDSDVLVNTGVSTRVFRDVMFS